LIAPGRSLLDDEAAFGHAHFERRVIEVTARTALEQGRNRFENAAVQAHRVAAGAQREPVQVNTERIGSHAGCLGAVMKALRQSSEQKV